jgi:hypothetical protein
MVLSLDMSTHDDNPVGSAKLIWKSASMRSPKPACAAVTAARMVSCGGMAGIPGPDNGLGCRAAIPSHIAVIE